MLAPQHRAMHMSTAEAQLMQPLPPCPPTPPTYSPLHLLLLG
jgi:hypothetical protein